MRERMVVSIEISMFEGLLRMLFSSCANGRMLASMLIRFKSEVGGFVMFGDVAVKLLRMTGHSGTVPGAIAADDVAQSLARLEAQVAAQTADADRTAKESREATNGPSSGAATAPSSAPPGHDSRNAGQDDGGDAKAEPVVSLAQRAFPMIELMRRAAAEPCAIQWLED